MAVKRPAEGDFCYVDLPVEGTKAGKVLSAGRDYEIRLKGDDRTVTAPDSAVWTTFPSKIPE